MEWYALFVETQKEYLVQKWIDLLFDSTVCHSLVPKRIITEKKQGKKHTIIKTMFPGYVFINTEMCIGYYYNLIKIPRVFRILSNGTYYSEIDEHEMYPILKMLNDKNVIDCSKVVIENSKVLVKSGPLFGMEGSIVKIDKRHGRAKVALELMGSPKLVDLGIEILETLD